eukprot:4408099-Prorocentrum_lima.AAC.1
MGLLDAVGSTWLLRLLCGSSRSLSSPLRTVTHALPPPDTAANVGRAAACTARSAAGAAAL